MSSQRKKDLPRLSDGGSVNKINSGSVKELWPGKDCLVCGVEKAGKEWREIRVINKLVD